MCLPPKLKIFLWLIIQGKLLTNTERMKRRLTSDNSCPICHTHSESLLHLLRDCPRVNKIWQEINCFDNIRRAMQIDWAKWLAANGYCTMKCYGGMNWNVLFTFTCWYIWKWRNKNIFEEGFQFPINPVKVIMDSVTEWYLAQGKKNTRTDQTTVALKWLKPGNGWVKLNVDGARANLNGKIGAGRVLRDQDGNWIHGFTAHIGQGQVLEAETWGMLLGLQMAANLGMDKVVVECDSEVLVSLMNNGVDDLHPLKTVINFCLHLQSSFSECVISHVFQEVNTVADGLSRCNLSAEIGAIYFEQPPPQVTNIVLDDLCEVLKYRKVATAIG
ncbi:putative ribonuclease H-like domain, reverse transcriptase zinc-binding domain-containing protein [Rosa chinensis]|uniref:Putative ribonuclease H-like domain, reverse transcriptase zinc-binding domain-containing protein n=1 Tax=Rosa chinensis TaxID=74649 RepID=A0A2P6PNR3_ROSCH|nr:putative ribonuclease H-like domain, reverse transcriptase zinc-binding domain-containing protein [Rosa chinensis]